MIATRIWGGGELKGLGEGSVHGEREREAAGVFLPKVKGGTPEGSPVQLRASARRETGFVANLLSHLCAPLTEKRIRV